MKQSPNLIRGLCCGSLCCNYAGCDRNVALPVNQILVATTFLWWLLITSAGDYNYTGEIATPSAEACNDRFNHYFRILIW
jgi:hypothetical protein